MYHAEGRYYNTNVDASNTIAWRKEYSFRDYLGNTRLAFTDRNANGIVDITGTASTSDILQENHYYAFGLAFEGAWLQNDAGVRDNQYMYNGKELHSDFGLGMYAYGARYYDPSIGRFIGVDPISDEFPFVTTFNYAENEPIANIDLHGLQKVGINNRLAQILGLPSSDRGIIKPASEQMRDNSPIKAGIKDGSFIVLELMGINAIDNTIATWLDPKATIKEKIGAGAELGATAFSPSKVGTGKGMGKAKGGVYSLSEPTTGTVKRTGRTKDMAQRKNQHANGDETKDLDFNEEYRTDDYAEQRGLEQKVYDANPQAQSAKGGLNKIKPIGDRNKKKPDYEKAADDYLNRNQDQ